MNKNRPQGNHKHLNISNRIEIEKGLINGDSFRSIAKKIGKDPSSISKEIRRHAKVVERKPECFAPVPCALTKDSKHSRGNACKLRHVCGDTIITKTIRLNKVPHAVIQPLNSNYCIEILN